MKIINIGSEKCGSRGLYRITYVNGFVYVGSFVNFSGHIIGETYFGSSRVAKKYGWRKDPANQYVDYNKSKISLLEILYLREEQKNIQTNLESNWILKNAEELGVASCAKVLYPKSILCKFKDGKLLNLHANDCSHLTSKEVRNKAEDTKHIRGVSNKGITTRYLNVDSFKESCVKGVKTRISLYGSCISNSCRKAALEYLRNNPDVGFGERSIQYHTASVATRKFKDSYKLGAEKAGVTISGRIHFIEKPVALEVLSESKILKFSSIIKAEKYLNSIGVHVTRATISQGLKRTNGNYLYKNKLNFKYL